MCFGKFVVPIETMTLGDADGNFKSVHMVELTAHWSCYTWFWKQLGVSRADFKKGTPNSLPPVKEIKASISAVRHKRKRDGKFYNEDDRPVAESLVIAVRGQQLTVLNDARRLALSVAESQDLLTWFVSELSQEIQADADLVGEVPGEAEAEVDADAPWTNAARGRTSRPTCPWRRERCGTAMGVKS